MRLVIGPLGILFMGIPSKEVLKALKNEGVDEVYHANSVITACHFLRSNSLLSRGSVERLGWYQTIQRTDEDDQRHSIWYDIFLDTVDIHERASRVNAYGPVLFVFDAKILQGKGQLWVTKTNPESWDDMDDSDRWFQDGKELKEGFVYGEFCQSIVVRHCGGSLPFGRYLKRIVLDDPHRKNTDDVDYFSMAVGALRAAMQYSNTSIEIERRECAKTCACSKQWTTHRLSSMFDPLFEE